MAEIFNPNRFGRKAKLFDLLPGTAFDLRTGWDLGSKSGRAECWARLLDEEPEFIVGSPPCGQFSSLWDLHQGKWSDEMHAKYEVYKSQKKKIGPKYALWEIWKIALYGFSWERLNCP